jgi:hypothetical protein
MNEFTLIAAVVVCLIGLTIALIGVVIMLACVNSARFNNWVDDGKDWP